MRSHRLIVLTAVLLALGYMWLRGGFDGLQPALAQAPPASASTKGLATATFAAGCFWCVEADFDKVPAAVKDPEGYHVAQRLNVMAMYARDDKLPAGKLTEYIEVESAGCTVGPNTFNVEDLTSGKKVAIFGLPGAFGR